MAPYNQAVKVAFTPSERPALLSDPGENGKVYIGTTDPEWNVVSVPNGGYALGLILESCIQYQSTTAHVDPLHITAHYLRTAIGDAPFKVYIRTLKTGKGFTNLAADLYQEGILRITTHAIFGVNGPAPDDKLKLTLKAPSPYARRFPLHSHPSQVLNQPRRVFSKNMQSAEDPDLVAKNGPDHPNRTDSSTIGGGGLEWGAWFTFTGETEILTNSYLAFLVDMYNNSVTLIPKAGGSRRGDTWFPTMTLAVDFKFPIPPPSSKHADRTVAVYSNGRFINDPQGRHDIYVEVWTAPSNIGEGQPEDGWRDDQICLATATQMALSLPMAVNIKKGRKAANNPKL